MVADTGAGERAGWFAMYKPLLLILAFLTGVIWLIHANLLAQTTAVGVYPVSYTHLDVYKRQRYPRGGIVDSVEIGDEVERTLVHAGEHEAARAYAERGLRSPGGDPGKGSVQAPAESEQESLAEEKKTAATDIYLSYAHADQSVARELAKRLADAGLRVFLDCLLYTSRCV